MNNLSTKSEETLKSPLSIQTKSISDDVFFNDDSDVDSDYNGKRNKKCCTKHNCCNCFRKFITFMVSRVGLLILMVGYVCAGGLIFQELEAENERQSYKKSIESIDTLVNRIYERIQKNSIEIEDKSFGRFLTNEIENFRDFVTNSTQNGTFKSGNPQQWDYFGAVFYSVTLVSTIGYGHITCKTKNGKIFTVVYSALGVPLMMLFLANIGSSTATMFKFIYMRISSFRRRYKMRKFLKSGFKNFEFDCQLVDDKMLKYLRANSGIVPDDFEKVTHNEIVVSESTEQTQVKRPLEENNTSSPNETNTIFDSSDYAEYAKAKPSNFYLSSQYDSLNHITDILSLGLDKVDEELLETLKEIDDIIIGDLKDKSKNGNDLNEKRKSVNFKSIEELSHEETNENKVSNENETQGSKKKGLFKTFSFRKQKVEVEPKNINDNSVNSEEKVKEHKEKKRKATSFKEVKKKQITKRRFSTAELPSITEPKVELKRQTSFNDKPTTQEKIINKNEAKSLIFRSSITTNQAKASILKNSTTNQQHQIYSSINKFEFNKKQLKYIYREYKQQQREDVGVPLFITLIIMPLYLVAGMIIFSSFEGWSKLDAFYFSFITLVTIGFGDFIPGSSLSLHSNIFRMSVSSLYILVGLVLIAMCFNLMKKQFKKKIKQIARRLGFSNC